MPDEGPQVTGGAGNDQGAHAAHQTPGPDGPEATVRIPDGAASAPPIARSLAREDHATGPTNSKRQVGQIKIVRLELVGRELRGDALEQRLRR